MTNQVQSCPSFESSDLCTKCGEARRWHTDAAPKPYGYTADATTIALPSQWECAYGPFDDEPFCQETEDDGHTCPTIRVHRDDAEALSKLVDQAKLRGDELAELRDERAALLKRLAETENEPRWQDAEWDAKRRCWNLDTEGGCPMSADPITELKAQAR